MDAFELTLSTAVTTQPRTNEFDWHSLLRQFTVAEDEGIRIVDLQTAEQGNEGGTLGRSTGVGITAFLVQPSFIADADGMGIIMAGMHANLIFRAGLIDLTIALNIVMVTDAFAVETGIVIVTEHIDGVALVATGRRAVNDNEIYSAHDCTAIVLATEVMTVARNLSTFATVRQLTFIIIHTE